MIQQSEPWLGESEIRQLIDCIENNWITGGQKVREFENWIAGLCGVQRAVACANGTSALFLGLKALGIGRGDEVIVPDFTFIASANSVVLADAQPVFVDIDEKTLNIDPDRIEQAITDKTKAIMPVHLYGQSADMDRIMEIAGEYNLLIIEDNAQGIGVTWNGKPTGGFGNVGCLSFYADKALTTGEGGMILADNSELADTCIRLSHQGNLHKGSYVHESLGFNFRMTDLQAAVGLAQLDKLPEIIERRKRNEALYRELLSDVVLLPEVDSRCFNVPFRIVILVDDPESLRCHLEKNGIEARRVFYPLHSQPCYQVCGSFPNSEKAYRHGLALPSWTMLTEEQVRYICSVIREYYGDN